MAHKVVLICEETEVIFLWRIVLSLISIITDLFCKVHQPLPLLLPLPLPDDIYTLFPSLVPRRPVIQLPASGVQAQYPCAAGQAPL